MDAEARRKVVFVGSIEAAAVLVQERLEIAEDWPAAYRRYVGGEARR